LRTGADVLHLHGMVTVFQDDQITGFELRHSASSRRAKIFGPQ
jgi:hypothetical protein